MYVFFRAAIIPEEQLSLCGAGDCGLNVSNSNITTTRPAQELVWKLVGSYIGNVVT